MGADLSENLLFVAFGVKILGAEFWLFGEFKGADLRGILPFFDFCGEFGAWILGLLSFKRYGAFCVNSLHARGENSRFKTFVRQNLL